MTTTSRFGGLGKTQHGRTQQLNHAYKGLAADMKRRQLSQPVDCDEPQTMKQALALIARLRNENAELRDLLDADRQAAYSDAPAADVVRRDTTAMVANRSDVSISTICRHAADLNGIQLASGDWLFPAGTTYGRKRKRK